MSLAALPTFAAHGVGGSTDLPIPFLYAMVGASWALTISFAVLALAWRTPRLQGERSGERRGSGSIAVVVTGCLRRGRRS